MKHLATPDFWDAYETLPAHIQRLADKNYQLLKRNPHHPSLHFKRIGRFRSVRIFWIGNHAAYDKLIGS